MDRDVFSLTEQRLQAHVDTLHRRPWSMVEATLGPIVREVMASDPAYGKRFADNMLLAAGMLDTFASDAARVAATGGEPSEVSQRFNQQLEQLKTSVNVKTDTGARKQAAIDALNHVQALMDWNYLEENAL